MRGAVGIDLGSTTTKAVILAEDGSVLGRGLTNTRSNYEVACRVALGEARVRARLALVAARLATSVPDPAERASLLGALEAALRRRRHLGRLEALRDAVAAAAAGAPGEPGRVASRIAEALVEEAAAPSAHAPSRDDEFFRDRAGGAFLARAEEIARAGGPPFERLAGIFDKAILVVENAPPEESEAGLLARALGDPGVGDSRLREAATRAAEEAIEEIAVVGTGYGRQRLPFPKERIRSEILCHGLGAHALFPGTRTLLDIGGQDTKAIQVDARGIVTAFQMNDRCAAGCGRYLGYIADEMNLALHELGPLAASSSRPTRISSTCTVFAGAELRERLSLGERREDILAGLHRAIVLRAMSLLARSGGVTDQFTFTGGVARNPAAVEALRRLVRENYGEVTMNVSPDSIYTGALGAALFARREAFAPAAA